MEEKDVFKINDNDDFCQGKKCLLLIDTGLDQSMFANSLLGDISNYVWPIQVNF